MGIIATLISLPHLLIFFGIWIVASIARPVILATMLCLIAQPRAAREKLKLFMTTTRFLLLSRDKKWKTRHADAASFQATDPDVESKTILFLRHGESTWNDTFNKGDRKPVAFILGFFPNLMYALMTEWYFLLTGQAQESWFFDSPLSPKGQAQALGVQTFLRTTDPSFATPKEARLIALMKGTSNEPCQIMCSNLRRAISTCAIALEDRLAKEHANDQIMIVSELQEVSINPDALSIHPPKAALVTSWIDSTTTQSIYAKQCDTSHNTGNKPLSSNGLIRMTEFCQIIFDEKKVAAPNICATGHSFWFRAFFQTYLPQDFVHVCKKKKLINGGVAGFTLMRKKDEKGDYQYLIDPSSLVVLYGGF